MRPPIVKYVLWTTALVALAFGPFLWAGRVSDDIFFADLYRVGSLRATLLEPWPHSFGQASAWRPVVLLSYGLNAWLTPGSAVGYRVLNVVVHAICAWLLALLVQRLTRRPLAGLVAGALFVVHPIVHENVIWISGRTYPLAAMFGLALLVWTLGRRERSGRLQHGVGGALLIAALASYESAVVLPVALLILLWADEGVTGFGRSEFRAAFRFLAPYVSILALYLAFRWLWLSDVSGDVTVAARASQWQPGSMRLPARILRNSLFFVLKLLDWPWFDRGSDISFGWRGLSTTVVAIAAVGIALRDRRTRRAALACGAWGMLFFVPFIAYVGFADRFGYLSAASLAAAIGVATAAVLDRGTRVLSTAWLAVVALVWTMWLVDLRARGRDWVEAGVLVQRVVNAALAVEPGPTEPVDLHFVGVPRVHGSAAALITYFPQAVWKEYDAHARTQVHFFMSWDDPDTVVERLQHETHIRSYRVYWWNAEAGQMELKR